MPADSRIHFRCPHCKKSIAVAQQHASKHGKCPGCGEDVQIPSAEDALDFDTMIECSMAELRTKTAAHDSMWQLSKAQWDLSQNTGTIVFTSPSGIVATCPVQIVGTFDSSGRSWMWGWDHPSVDPALQEHARLCKAYGEKHGIRALTAHKVANTTEDDGWQFTALACKLAGAQGGYRATQGNTRLFVTIGTPSLTNNQSQESSNVDQESST